MVKPSKKTAISDLLPNKPDSSQPASVVSVTADTSESNPGFLSRLWSQFGGIVAAALLVLVARGSLVDHYYVPSGSMKPTVEIDDHIIVDKKAYGLRVPLTQTYILHFDQPKRGDVVVLDSPEDDSPVLKRVLLKRIVGLPGDDISVSDGRIYLSGVPVPVKEEDGNLVEVLDGRPHRVNLKPQWGGTQPLGPSVPGNAIPDSHIPPDKFLVMGDNRGDSHDGRFFGLVDRREILGRAMGTIEFSNVHWTDL
jgi:signal peptidase I